MTDTIAAVSTAIAPAGIGIIRISGPEAIAVADKIIKGVKASSFAKNSINHGWIEFNGNVIDEVLISLFKEPHSYTGEDIVEINCHGGVVAVRKILDAVLSSGARCALPGEFTKRAFLNGKIDLSKAEAVMDIISAKSEYALQSAISQLKGSLYKEISLTRGRLIYELAYIESALDDPEHISLDGYTDKLARVVKNEIENLTKLSKTSEKGKYIEDGIKTVILGRPNVGKSSLLNMIAGKERAIVTEIPGTTRDVIEETVNIGKIALKILDTAGIHEAKDKAEQLGIQMAWEKANEADLILYVIDGSDDINKNDAKILKKLSDKKGILLLNKNDLPMKVTKNDVCQLTRFPVIEISARDGTGENEIQTLIENMFFNGELTFNDEIFITNIRHKRLIDDAINSLKYVEQSISDKMPEDFCSIDLSGAINSLDCIIGGNLSEDLIDEIFSRFCTGK